MNRVDDIPIVIRNLQGSISDNQVVDLDFTEARKNATSLELDE
jgi:hypothetical protein